MQGLTLDARPVPEQIAALGKIAPHALALRDGDRELTYQELDRQANQFANYLSTLGVAPGGAVALCMERSFDWIIAALGILRAGAAYVPLDASWPETRLSFAVKDSGASVLVARKPLLERLGLNAQVAVQGVDPARDAATIAATPLAAPRTLSPQSLAYIIYTSGSTGTPKGVEITHANLSHLVRWHRDTFGVTQQDRASHLLGLGFDAAVMEIWPHLCSGASLCIADEGARSSPDLIQEWLLREGVTITLMPTVLGERLMTLAWPENTKLRLLIMGGDVLQQGPMHPLPFDVVNNYGPTECTVSATYSVLVPGDTELPPIGHAITGAHVYLLDEEGKPVSDGEMGEIYIGGDGVGRGYRNRDELTQQKFLADPFANTAAARMYRSGDRGKRRPDGQVEFRGRQDRQTKIRGFRVELDEIANTLTRYGALDFATVVTRTTGSGENELVAYVLPKVKDAVLTANALQEHLLQSLPDYMVPPTFICLDTLPLSANGKIDLARLAHSTDGRLLQRAAAKMPVSTIEQKVLVIVRDLLRNDAIGTADNFFLVGGHSLLAAQLLVRLRQELGVDLSLRQLFGAPTVQGLALWVEQADAMDGAAAERSDLPAGVVALQPKGTRNGIFWMHYFHFSLAAAVGEDQPFFVVRLMAEDLEALGEAPTFESIAARHVAKILSVQPCGPYTVGGLCLGATLAFEIAQQLRAGGHQVSLLILLDPASPAYLESPEGVRPRWSEAGYLLRRAARLGPRHSLVRILRRVLPRLAAWLDPEPPPVKIDPSQQMLERAAVAYKPRDYHGRALLLLASERPPHIDFLPAWQAVLPYSLHTVDVDAHHEDLIKGRGVQQVVDAIESHLELATEQSLIA